MVQNLPFYIFEFLHFLKPETDKINKGQSPQNGKNDNFRTSRPSKINFTQNLSDRKILKFSTPCRPYQISRENSSLFTLYFLARRWTINICYSLRGPMTSNLGTLLYHPKLRIAIPPTSSRKCPSMKARFIVRVPKCIQPCPCLKTAYPLVMPLI